jgi:hypothetical protein
VQGYASGTLPGASFAFRHGRERVGSAGYSASGEEVLLAALENKTAVRSGVLTAAIRWLARKKDHGQWEETLTCIENEKT